MRIFLESEIKVKYLKFNGVCDTFLLCKYYYLYLKMNFLIVYFWLVKKQNLSYIVNKTVFYNTMSK